MQRLQLLINEISAYYKQADNQPSTVMEFAFEEGLKGKYSYHFIIKMYKDFIKTNQSAMVDELGKDLVNKIKLFRFEEVELEFETGFMIGKEGLKIYVKYYSESPETNRLHDVIVNGWFPVDTAELSTNKNYEILKSFITDAMLNNSKSYWDGQKELLNENKAAA